MKRVKETDNEIEVMEIAFMEKETDINGKEDRTRQNKVIYKWTKKQNRGSVVAQLVERLLLTFEVRGSNPVIGKFYIEHLFTLNYIEKTKIKEKRDMEWPF